MRSAFVLVPASFLMPLTWCTVAAAADPTAPEATPSAPASETAAEAPTEPAADADAPVPVADAAPSAPESSTNAEQAAVSPEPQGKIFLTAPHEKDTGPRTFHTHDGFYLRTNFGFGMLWGGFTASGDGERHLDADGSGIALDLLIGGSPSPGISIGGGLIGNWLFGAEFEDEDGEIRSDHDVTSGLVGVFIDGFPQPHDGWHLGGLVGLGGHTLNRDGVADQTGGFGGAIWAGYDQWVGDDFSVGGMLRFTAMRSTGEKDGDDISASTASLGLMFTGLYH